MVGSLVLTVTRACNLRCSYCPTAKDGWPSLTATDSVAAVDLFADRFGGGDIKIFGGEPLLVPEVVRAAIERAARRPEIRRVYLSTNGLGLDADWLRLVRDNPKLILTVSIDGRPEDHRRLRRALEQVPDSYDHLMTLLPQLRETPRLVVTQTVAPATAAGAADNFRHLRGLGFWRFNFLPGYFIRWQPAQLEALKASFAEIAESIAEQWRQGERLYVRNLFTRAPTPFFNSGIVVDADGSIHPSNVGLSGALEELLEQTRVGSLDAPPSPAQLEQKSLEVNALIEAAVTPEVWQSTLAVDAMLTRFSEGLYPAFVAQRRRRRAA